MFVLTPTDGLCLGYIFSRVGSAVGDRGTSSVDWD
jgi:hypothetical protein